MDEIRVEGLDDLREMLLKRLPQAMQGKALQVALAKAVQPMVKSARAMAPVRSGRLRKAIYTKRSKFSKPGFEARIMAVRHGKRYQKTNKDAYYWKFIEFGHRIGARGQSVKNSVAAGKSGNYLKKTTRPEGAGATSLGVYPARPFMRLAFEINKLKAVEIIRDELAGAIKKVGEQNVARGQRRLRKALLGF